MKLSNKSINDNDIQNLISIQLADFIETVVLKLNKKKYLKIIELKGLKNNKKLENIFLNKLKEIYSQNSIQLIDQETIVNKNFANYFFIKILFDFNNIDNNKIKISINWEILDKNENFIGSIKQENVIKKSIINYAWEEISNKIIEMSITELNMMINL